MRMFSTRNNQSNSKSQASRRRRFRPYRLHLENLEDRVVPDGASWTNFGHDPHHTGISEVPAQSFDMIRWQTPMDLDPQFSNGDLYTHYGSPLVTPNNTVIIPVKTGKTGGYRVEAHSGVDGTLLWMEPTDYLLPPHSWIPSYAPVVTPKDRLYFAGI